MIAVIWVLTGLPVADLERVAAALAQQREQVRTLYCEFQLAMRAEVTQCRFAMNGRTVRVTAIGPVRKEELWSDGVTLRSIRAAPGGRTECRIDEAHGAYGMGDARHWGLQKVTRVPGTPKDP